MNIITVILIDDHSIVREGLRMIIENDDEIKVVGESDNMEDGLRLVKAEQPDVVLLDLDLGNVSSIVQIEEIFAANASSRVLVLTGVTDQEQHKAAMQKGAQGVLLKNNAAATLLKAIKKIHQGEAWIDRTLTAKLLAESHKTADSNSVDKLESLTTRELEIVELIAEGLTNKEIASRLFVGEKTVRNNLTVIYSKLDVSSRLELAIYASRN